MRRSRLMILPALTSLLLLALPAAPASAIVPLPTATCPCWEAGGPFYTPASWCFDLGSTRFGFQPGTFAQTVTYGAGGYCRKNGFFGWTSPAEHAACNDALHVACSPILAVAYIDRNSNDVFDGPDGLIAKLVDTDGNGADAGDVMVTDVYPASPSSTAVGGTFATKATACSDASSSTLSAICGCIDELHYRWITSPSSERWITFRTFEPEVADVFAVGNDDFVRSPGPLGASVPTTVFTTQPGDQNFIDVDIFVP